VTVSGGDTSQATVTATARPNWLGQVAARPEGVAHVILTVTDDGSPSLTSYRRVIVKVRVKPAAGR
jgi:hypothetical protein